MDLTLERERRGEGERERGLERTKTERNARK